MSFCVYILFSPSLDKFYVGSTDNVDKRLIEHNSGFYKGAYTSKRSDWEIFLHFNCSSRQRAKLIESHIKNMKSSTFIRNLKLHPEIIEKLIIKYS